MLQGHQAHYQGQRLKKEEMQISAKTWEKRGEIEERKR